MAGFVGLGGTIPSGTATRVVAGPQGPAGAQGTSGTPGAAGTNGSSILHGTGVPGSGTGSNGDFYLDTAASVLYGPKASGAWPGSGVSLIGPAGNNGATGAAGTSGVLAKGQATLVAGVATVATSAIASNSIVLLSCAAASATVGLLHVAAIVPGVSFNIQSTSADDTSTVNWGILA